MRPFSGGDVGTKNATLAIMCGCDDPAAVERVEPLLRRMGKSITYCGNSGTGQLTKLVNQILVSVTNLATCEALTFAKKNGLDVLKTIEAVGSGAAGSWQLLNLGPKMAASDNRPGFMIDLQQKGFAARLAIGRAGKDLSARDEPGAPALRRCAGRRTWSRRHAITVHCAGEARRDPLINA